MRKQLLLFLLLLSPWWVQAQTGPAGIGNATGSSGQPENILWLRASDLGLANDAPVTVWADQSGNGNDMLQQGADAVPFFRNDGLSGSFDVVRFDGTERYLVLGDRADLDDNMSGLTMIVVSRLTGIDASPRGILSKRNGSNNQDSYSLFTHTGSRPFFDVSGGGNNSRLDGTVALNGTTDYIISAVYDGTTQSLFTQTEFRASRAETGNVDNTTSNLYMGALNNDYGTYLNGDIAEVILYKEALNGAQRRIIENYLAEKYNITPTIADLFSNATYNADITGIGTENGTEKVSASIFSDALQIEEANNGLDAAGEYLMIAHNSGVAHTSDTETADVADVDITNRWNKDYYIQRTGVSDVKLRFDFGNTIHTIGSASDYVLIYRSGTTGEYTRVAAIDYAIENTDQLVITVPGANLETGYYTVARGNQITSRTWYVLTNGNWDDFNTWTLDPSTAPFINNPGNEIPGQYDNIFIRNGKEVTITTDGKQVLGATIKGSLKVGTSTGHNFNLIEGTGIISVEGNAGLDNFPAGTTTTPNGFGNPLNGGTLLVSGTNGFTWNQDHTTANSNAFNNVRIELTDATDVVSLGADVLINGELTVRNGTLGFGDGTTANRTLEVRGDVIVENNGGTRDGRISTAVANARHEFNLYGDFINQGTASFTQRSAAGWTTDATNANDTYYQNEATDGIVDFNILSPNQDQTISLNGITNFYRIEVNKGSDATYIATLQADDANNFHLLGFANDDLDNNIVSTDQLSGNPNALGLITGTLRIGTNITVPVLNRAGNYAIGQNGRLWIDGGTVTKNVATAIVPYGVLEISAGTLTATGNSGITVRINGLLKVSGGTVNTNNIRTSVQGTQSLGGYQQTGGNVLLDGTLGAGSASGEYYIMSLTYPGNVFLMSGGTLTIRNANGRGGIFINSDPGNVSVTGGTVVMESSNNNDFLITSRAEFYNAQMFKSGGTGNFVLDGGTSGNGAAAATLAAQPLKVLGDLSLLGNETNPAYQDFKFYATTSATNVNDVYIGGGFRLEEGSQYIACFPDFTTDPATDYTYNGTANQPTAVNTTYFNQTIATETIEELYWGNNRYYDYDGIDDGGPNGINEDNDENMLETGRVVLDRTSGNELRLVSPNSGVNGGNRGNSSLTWDINGNAEVLSGTLDQGRLTIRIWGNIVNNDRMGTYYSAGPYPTGSGTPNTAQIRFREDGNLSLTTEDGAIFGNIRINVGVSGANPPLELTSDVIMERVEMMRGYLYLKGFNLQIDEMWNLDNDRNPTDDGAGDYYFVDNDASSLLNVFPETRHNNGGTRAGQIMFFTDGNKSDGGLTLKVTGNTQAETDVTRLGNTGPLTFPVGYVLGNPASPIPNNTPIYNRPAQVKVKNFVSEGYITIKPVSGELKTTELTGGEILQTYWAVSHTFPTGNEPDVALRFFYYNQSGVAGVDLPAGAVNEANYVPGYVLDQGDYARVYESDANTTNGIADGPNDVTDVDESTDIRSITFNGPDVNGEFTQAGFTGFTLVNANYTAGEPTRFIGNPTIYYSRAVDGTWFEWQETNHWSTDPINKHIGPPAGSFPGVGDIVVVGSEYVNSLTGGTYFKTGDGRHQIRIDGTVGDVEISQAEFDSQAGGVALNVLDLSRIRVGAGITFTAGTITGKGEIVQDVGPNPVNYGTIVADIGDFAKDPDNGWFFWVQANGTTVVNDFDAYPTFRTFGGTGTIGDRLFQFGKPVTAQNMLIDNRITFQVANNLTIDKEVRLGGNGSGVIEFIDNGSNLTLECNNVVMLAATSTEDNRISVENAGTDIHTFKINGDITLSEGNAFDLSSAGSNVILELAGNSGNNSVTDNTAGITMDLYKIQMNKGSDVSSSFLMPEAFTITAPSVSGVQPIEILNGKLILDNPAIDVMLTDASTGNFLLPNTLSTEATSGSGSLELRQGTARIEGDNTGIILDGALVISGGTLDMASGAGNGNNFIEYSSSGSASINVTGGVLDVGSQIRRGLTATTGVLDYTQTAGTARIGINTAPEDTRGVFEILNAGSSFTHTGGDFIIVRQNGSSTVGSLIMQPATFDFTGSTITIGDGSTPGTGQNNIGIDATVPLNTLNITGNGALTAKTFINSLELSNLVIDANGTFDANGLSLTMNDAFTNNGAFVSSGDGFNNQTTFFTKAGVQNITGTGTSTFYNLNHTAVGGILTLGKDISILNELNILNAASTFNTTSFAASVAGDVVLEGAHTSTPAGAGIVFNGSSAQNLERLTADTTPVGRLTIDNANGVSVDPDGHFFSIDHSVVLRTGVFSIGPNLLIFDNDAVIENGTGGTARTDFNVNNMITVNTSLIDRGIRKIYADGYTGTFTYPVGLSLYTPVEVISTGAGFVGTTANTGFITVKPIDAVSGGIDEDDDSAPCGTSTVTTDYTDEDNVLKYFWLLKSSNVSEFTGSFNMYYESDALVGVNNTEGLDATNYGPARLLNNESFWDKDYSRDLFDETNRVITFSRGDYVGLESIAIQGRYTAGITRDDSDDALCGNSGAIPEQVAEYITAGGQGETALDGGPATDVQFDPSSAGGGGIAPPPIGISPDLRITSGDNLILDRNAQQFRKVTIENGATLIVPEGVTINLGTVISNGGQLVLRKSSATDPNFPAGDFDDYFPEGDCTGGQGGLVYENTSTANGNLSVLPNIAAVSKLTVTGNGVKVLANNSTVCNDLEITGGEFDMGAVAQQLTVKGNIIKSAGTTYSDGNGGKILLNGSAAQTISGDFSGSNMLNDLELNNANGLTITGSSNVEVGGTLTFSNGLINTTATDRLIIDQDASLTGYNASRHVNGPLVRELTSSASTDSKPFPVGTSAPFGRAYGLIGVRNVNFGAGTGAAEFTATYIYGQPSQDADVSAGTGGAPSTDTGQFSTDMNNAGIQKLSDADYWTVDAPSARLATSQFDLNWTVASDVQDPANLRVVFWNYQNSTSWDMLTAGAPSGNGTNGSISTTESVSYSTNVIAFATTNQTLTPLPVELIDFDAEKFGEDEVEVLWTTATEFNNDYFVVEHSMDGQNFQAVGQVDGAGDSNEMKNYRFVHEEPRDGVNYYRLKQVDNDGSFSYSRVANVTMEGLEEALIDPASMKAVISAFPNPIKNGRELGVEAKHLMPETMHQVELVDLAGRTLTIQQAGSDAQGTLSSTLSIGNELETGLYIIRISDGGHVYTKKVAVIR